MRQYAVLQNVARGINFGVVVKSNGNLRYFGWTQRAIEWAQWANANTASLENLPYGVSVGEFKGLSDEMMRKIIVSSDEATAVDMGVVEEKAHQFELDHERFATLSKLPSVTDSALPMGTKAKLCAVSFKAQNFKKEVATNEIALKMRLNQLAFNNETKQFNGKPNRASSLAERHDIQTKMSRGAERQFGKQIVNEINRKVLDSTIPLNKRDQIGSNTKEILDVYVKASLGRTIGRAGRALTPNRGNRGRMRGMASRVITGVRDRMKRRDANNNGLIFDGTIWEQPDPTPNRGPDTERLRSGRLRGDLNLPGGGGVGIRSTDPEENRRAEDRLRAEMEMRREFSERASRASRRAISPEPVKYRDGKPEPSRSEPEPVKYRDGKRPRSVMEDQTTRRSRSGRNVGVLGEGRPREEPSSAWRQPKPSTTTGSRSISREPDSNLARDPLAYSRERMRSGRAERNVNPRALASGAGMRPRFGDNNFERPKRMRVRPAQFIHNMPESESDGGMRMRRRSPLAKVYVKGSRLAIAAHYDLDEGVLHLYTRDGKVRHFEVPYEDVRALGARTYDTTDGREVDKFFGDLISGKSGKKVLEERISQERYNELADEYKQDYDQDPFDYVDTNRDRNNRNEKFKKPNDNRLPSGRGREALRSGRDDTFDNDLNEFSFSGYEFDDVLNKLRNNLRMTQDEMDFLEETISNILNSPNTTEDVRDAIFDLQQDIKTWKKGKNSTRNQPNKLTSGRNRGDNAASDRNLKIEGPRLSDRQANKIANAAQMLDDDDGVTEIGSATNLSRIVPKKQYNALMRALKREQRKNRERIAKNRDSAQQKERERRAQRGKETTRALTSGRNPEKTPDITDLWSQWMRGEALDSNELQTLVGALNNIIEDTDTDDNEKDELKAFRDELQTELKAPKRKFDPSEQALTSGRSNKPRKEVADMISNSYGSMKQGGDDFDTGIRILASDIGIKLQGPTETDTDRAFKELVGKLSKIDARNRVPHSGKKPLSYNIDKRREFAKELVDSSLKGLITDKQRDDLAEGVHAMLDAMEDDKGGRLTSGRRNATREDMIESSLDLADNDDGVSDDMRTGFEKLKRGSGVLTDAENKAVLKALKYRRDYETSTPDQRDVLDDLIEDVRFRRQEATDRQALTSGRITSSFDDEVLQRDLERIQRDVGNGKISLNEANLQRTAAFRAHEMRLGKRGGLSQMYDPKQTLDDEFGTLEEAERAADKVLQRDLKRIQRDVGNGKISLDEADLQRDAAFRAHEMRMKKQNDRFVPRGPYLKDEQILRLTSGTNRIVNDAVEDVDAPLIDAIRRFQNGERLTQEESNSIKPVLRELLDNNTQLNEDQRIELITMLDRLNKQSKDAAKLTSGRTAANLRDDIEKVVGEDENEVDRLVNAAANFVRGQVISPKDNRDLRNVLREILDNSSAIDEDERDRILDIMNDLEKAPANPSRMTSGRVASRRGGLDIPQGARRSLATMQRAATPRGLASGRGGRRPSQEDIMLSVGGGVGGTMNNTGMRRHLGRTLLEGDGEFWDSLTPEQKEEVKKALVERRKALEKSLKGGAFGKFWRGQVRGAQKQSARAVRKQVRGTGGTFDPRSEDAQFDANDIREMLRILDRAVAKPDDEKGAVQKFVMNEDGTLKVDADGNVELKDSSSKDTGEQATNYTRARRALDDLQTIMNMIEDDDFSALEHLHPTSKGAIVKAAKAKGAKAPKGFSTRESSIAKHAGGESKFKPRTSVDDKLELGTAKDEKRALRISQRLLRMNPERRARIRAREQRRVQQGKRVGYLADPTLEIKKRKLRGRAMARAFRSRFQKDRDPDELSRAINEQKSVLTPVRVSNDGTVTIDDQFLTTMQFMDKRLQEAQKLTNAGEKKKVYDQLLATLWVNMGFSETPTLITEDEARALIAAGWQPVLRGTGNKEVESESYVEQFLTSPDRFIPGEGMRAFGVGEYFAFPGTRWGGYAGNADTDRHSMLVLIPPSADIVKASELQRERDKMKDLTKRANTALRNAFGNTREGVAAREPGEIAETLRRELSNIDNETSRSGQIVRALISKMEDLEKLPRTTDEQRATVSDEKKKILDTLDYLDRFTDKAQGSELGYFAPIIGVDGIDTNDSDNPSAEDPFLLHNRSGVVAVQRPMTYNNAKALSRDKDGKLPGRTWLSWNRRADRSREGDAVKASRSPIRKARRSRGSDGSKDSGDGATKPDTPAPVTDSTSPAAPTPSAPAAGGTQAIDSWSRRRAGMGGSNPANIYTAPDGTQYYGKVPKGGENPATAQKRLETEVLAAKLYKLAGVPTVDSEMATDNGEPVMISKLIPNVRGADDRDSAEAQKGFVVDAWLANWDVMLNGNVQMDSKGNAVRTDVGGSLDHRAQGQLKGSGNSTPFGPSVGEIRTMAHDRGDYQLSNITPQEIKRQAQALSKLTDDDIRKTVMAVVKDPQRAAELADILIKRRDNIVKNYG